MSREERLEHMLSLVSDLNEQLSILTEEEQDEDFESLETAIQSVKEELEYLV